MLGVQLDIEVKKNLSYSRLRLSDCWHSTNKMLEDEYYDNIECMLLAIVTYYTKQTLEKNIRETNIVVCPIINRFITFCKNNLLIRYSYHDDYQLCKEFIKIN